MEPTSSHPRCPARSEAHVWLALLPQVIDCQDGPHHVFLLSFTIRFWDSFLFYLFRVFSFLFFVFIVLGILGTVRRKGTLVFLNCQAKVVPFTAFVLILTSSVSWKLLLDSRLAWFFFSFLLGLDFFFFNYYYSFWIVERISMYQLAWIMAYYGYLELNNSQFGSDNLLRRAVAMKLNILNLCFVPAFVYSYVFMVGSS